MSKKRTSLEDILGGNEPTAPVPTVPQQTPVKPRGNRPRVKQQTAYLPLPVYEQVRRLAFEEHAKMHDFLMEGLDHVFKARGLPSINDLTGKRL